MSTPKVFESEYRFCLILWDHEPIKSRDLAQLCEEQLGWKVTTTYTVIKRLSERGVIKNENTIVSSLVSKEQIQTAEIEELVEKKFAGSPVAGHANVLVFPDLNCGNSIYKATERLGGATAIGPICNGLRKPFVDGSRGCSVDDIVDMAAVCAVTEWA